MHSNLALIVLLGDKLQENEQKITIIIKICTTGAGARRVRKELVALCEAGKTSFRDSLAEAIGHLPDREQLVMSLYYDHEMTLREIGEVLDEYRKGAIRSGDSVRTK